MKIKKLFQYTSLLLFVIFNVFADEIEFEAEDLKIANNGNLVFAYNSKTKIPDDKLEIISKNVEYYKDKNIIKFINDVTLYDLKNNIKIETDNLIYKKKIDLIFSSGKTNFDIKNKYIVDSENVYFDRKTKQLYGNKKTSINDFQNNLYILDETFNIDLNKDIIKSKKSTIIDNKNNKYIFEDLVINLKNNEIAGKEIKVEFEKSYFGNKQNDPLLKGRSAYSNDNELKIYKAVFSTCNTLNKKCRGWELNSKEFNHDKQKKIFEYKDSWLKIFDFKVIYLPYFNHPDPTVKRKTGFLTPSYKSSENFGTSINFPYFKVLDIDKDITFNPRYYADKSFLLQNEYRQVLKKSKILSDFGFLIGEAGTKGHLFYNIVGSFDNNKSYELNLEGVKGDNYLKNHSLKDNSLLIDNENLLLSNLDIDWDFEDSQLSTSFKIYEDLSRGDHNRYQYVFPNLHFIKNIDIPREYNGKFTFDTYGYNSIYNTNVKESVLINNFHFEKNDLINSSGVVTKFDFLLKNANSYAENSSEYKENENYEVFETIKIDNHFPLIKKNKTYTYYLNPRSSLRYSPNGNTDLSKNDFMLNYSNAFSLDRIGVNSQVEGGAALTLGLEFKKNDEKLGNILDFRLGNVIRPNKDFKLPAKSKLNQTRSDIFGDLKFKLNEYMTLGYSFSYDRDLDYSNLDSFNLGLGANNFISEFKYYTENNDFGDEENIKNFTRYVIDQENSVKFSTSKDLKDDFTEYYNLIYEYLTDCISLNLNYNKTFYSDGNSEPDSTLSFLIKIIPFTELGVPNIGNVVNR